MRLYESISFGESCGYSHKPRGVLRKPVLDADVDAQGPDK